MLFFILTLAVFGLLAGALARLLVPGPDPMGLLGTWALGIVGSFVGGFLGWFLFGTDLRDGAVQSAGLVGSVLGAVLVLVLFRAASRRA